MGIDLWLQILLFAVYKTVFIRCGAHGSSGECLTGSNAKLKNLPLSTYLLSSCYLYMAALTSQLGGEIHSGTSLSQASGASGRLASVCQASLASPLMFPLEEPIRGQQRWARGSVLPLWWRVPLPQPGEHQMEKEKKGLEKE